VESTAGYIAVRFIVELNASNIVIAVKESGEFVKIRSKDSQSMSGQLKSPSMKVLSGDCLISLRYVRRSCLYASELLEGL